MNEVFDPYEIDDSTLENLTTLKNILENSEQYFELPIEESDPPNVPIYVFNHQLRTQTEGESYDETPSLFDSRAYLFTQEGLFTIPQAHIVDIEENKDLQFKIHSIVNKQARLNNIKFGKPSTKQFFIDGYKPIRYYPNGLKNFSKEDQLRIYKALGIKTLV